MPDDQDDRYQRITLRIPKEMHGYLMREAEARTRSMNAEIIDRLEGSFRDAQGRPPKELQDALNRYLAEQEEFKKELEEIRQWQLRSREREKKLDDSMRRIEDLIKSLPKRSSSVSGS